MIRLLYLFFFVCITSQANAFSDDVLFQHALQSYAAKNEIALTEDASQLNNQHYILAPYADYWLMSLRLEQAEDTEILNFLTQYADMPFADRLRGEWLKKLGKAQNWPLFFEQYHFFQPGDVGVQCYALLGQHSINQLDPNSTSSDRADTDRADSSRVSPSQIHPDLFEQDQSLVAAVDIMVQAKALWLTSADLPSHCNQLFDVMQKSGELTQEDIWARFRLALQDGKVSLAKNISLRLIGLFNVEAINLKLLDQASQSPQSFLDKKTASFKTRFGAEANLYALDRLARTQLDTAISVYSRTQDLFDADNRAFGWSRVAYHAARMHHPHALDYFLLAKNINLDKEQLAWQARAALRANEWPTVLSVIAAMQPTQREEGAWRYWKARALKASDSGGQSALLEANALFSQLSKERHYYGWLAADELDIATSPPNADYSVSNNEVAVIAGLPAIKRALELQRLNMRWEAKAEWAWAMRSAEDKELLAAAEYAVRQKWYDIAISTADNTKQVHNFALRYPTPYRDLVHASAVDNELDEAWVYGLTRQESRFMHYAKSGVGAAGLMQLMPATAKWAARRMGLGGYSNDMIHDLRANIQIGTYYMRYTQDLMGGQAVMATAGYNAGPSRAKRWLASEPMEAAIYIESIPFTETRNYVQKVMANAHLYAPRLGAKLQSLKSRLGIVPGNKRLDIVETEIE